MNDLIFHLWWVVPIVAACALQICIARIFWYDHRS
jgi:hypothetical protein